jgi:hypothetical protein
MTTFVPFLVAFGILVAFSLLNKYNLLVLDRTPWVVLVIILFLVVGCFCYVFAMLAMAFGATMAIGLQKWVFHFDETYLVPVAYLLTSIPASVIVIFIKRQIQRCIQEDRERNENQTSQ